jgi:hypothetical protein
MMRRFGLATMFAVATIALPAFADVTVKSPDGTMTLTFPNGWKELTPKGKSVKIAASDGNGARLTVRSYAKDDFKDIKALAAFTVGQFKFSDANTKSEDIQVNGKPAVRLDTTGTEANGRRMGVVVTVFEAEGSFVDIEGTAPASQYVKVGPVMGGLVNQLKVTPAAPTR